MMRILLLAISLFSATYLSAQPAADTKDTGNTTTVSQKAFNDVNGRNVQELIDSAQRHQKAEKRKAFLNIGIGVAMLGVLVYGLSRKKRN
jgi:hypothetical protein